ncbi:18802_t:CDS:1, partial [Racocetra fulgida]
QSLYVTYDFKPTAIHRVLFTNMASYFSDRHRDSENSKLRVYAKTAVHSCVIHKMLVCALRGKERKD